MPYKILDLFHSQGGQRPRRFGELGGATAIPSVLAMWEQSDPKRALAWSTVALEQRAAGAWDPA